MGAVVRIVKSEHFKKIIYGVLVWVVIIAIMMLTFQGPSDTTMLSEGMRSWLTRFGIEISGKALRSHIHIVEYFIAGGVFLLFADAMGWKRFIPVLFACAFGLMDETIKIFLPTREFDAVDLVKDWVGVALAWLVVWACMRRKETKHL